MNELNNILSLALLYVFHFIILNLLFSFPLSKAAFFISGGALEAKVEMKKASA